MNYRHAFHAGNPGDVLKHLVLVLLLDHLRRKESPFAYLETHAGRGLYDLAADAASRTGEHESGIRRLWGEPAGSPALARYLEIIARFNDDGRGDDERREGGGGQRAATATQLRHYPGSPSFVQALLRPDDRMTLCELHPEEHQALRRQLGDDPRVGVHRVDGYHGLKAFLPPAERRGLVLIDPPFERADEYDALVRGLQLAHRRFPAGILAAWYPVKRSAPLRAFESALASAGIPKILRVELSTTADLEPKAVDPDKPERMVGSRLVIVNPPWRLDESLRDVLPGLARRLASDERGGRWRVDWLVAERQANTAGSPARTGSSARAGSSARTGKRRRHR